jgi:alpha-methylacyl-CoA racemase
VSSGEPETADDLVTSGPLAGLKVIEMAGLAPAPFAGMVLADHGAMVIRVDRAVRTHDGPRAAAPPLPTEILGRGRDSVAINLKDPAGTRVALALVGHADVLIEGFRPGVMERLGLGPDTCLRANPRLVYARVTGWGQSGPLADEPGHDINYLALSGALSLIGDADGPPVPPANLLADFAGGGLLAAFGVVAALYERQASGKGQVVDAAMVDGAALLTTMIHGLRAAGEWTPRRNSNTVDGGAPYYTTYRTADDEYVAAGAVEPQFYRQLVLGTRARVDPAAQHDRAAWAQTKRLLQAAFGQASRNDWAKQLAGTEACVTPVLSLSEAADHEHNLARGLFIDVGGVRQPAPAPRFSRSRSALPQPPPHIGSGGPGALRAWGVPEDLIASALADGAVAQPGTDVAATAAEMKGNDRHGRHR